MFFYFLFAFPLVVRKLILQKCKQHLFIWNNFTDSEFYIYFLIIFPFATSKSNETMLFNGKKAKGSHLSVTSLEKKNYESNLFYFNFARNKINWFGERFYFVYLQFLINPSINEIFFRFVLSLLKQRYHLHFKSYWNSQRSSNWHLMIRQ